MSDKTQKAIAKREEAKAKAAKKSEPKPEPKKA